MTITYFGLVNTAMARMTLDPPRDKAPEKMRISPDKAAAGVLRAVERGQLRTIIPAHWKVLDFIRLFDVHGQPAAAQQEPARSDSGLRFALTANLGPKGGDAALRERGIEALRRDVAELMPEVGRSVEALRLGPHLVHHAFRHEMGMDVNDPG